jgi:hypothetical protein
LNSASLRAALAEEADEIHQALCLLAFGGIKNPENMPLGAGDRHLLTVYGGLTGESVEVNATCPECATVNSAVLTAGTLGEPISRNRRLGSGGGLREPTYTDLLDLPADPATAEKELLSRCTVGSPAREPTAADLEQVDDSLSGPLVLICSECGARVERPIDVQRVVLELIERYLAQVDVEIHLLARAYHWELATIEGLPDDYRTRLARLVAEGM